MTSRLLTLAFTGLGLALLAWLLVQADTGALVREVLSVGVSGFAILVAIYCAEFTLDVLSWQLTIKTAPTTLRWAMRLFSVRIAGEAYNVITPLGGMGGEPIKALLLRRHYNVPYAVSGASLVLAKTMNVLALVLFLGAGFVMMLGDVRIGEQLQIFAAAGLIGLTMGIVGFIATQRLQLVSWIARRLESRRPDVARFIVGVKVFDHHLASFYATSPARFTAVLTFAFGNWLLGALGVWATMQLMGHPISFYDAWIIEAMAQMVRAATFFIPASLGAQDGAIVLFSAAVTGQADSGLAVALLRRAREVLWVLAGLAVSVRMLGTLRPLDQERT